MNRRFLITGVLALLVLLVPDLAHAAPVAPQVPQAVPGIGSALERAMDGAAGGEDAP